MVSDEFERILTRLKREGSNLLLTGDVDDETRRRASRYFYGNDPQVERARILALTEEPSIDAADHFVHATPGDPQTKVIDHVQQARSAAADATSTTVESGYPSDLANLRREIITAISFFDDRASGLESSRLRLGVNSLNPLFANYPEQDVHQFLRALTKLTKGVTAMSHYHLSMADDDDLVRELSPLFDARIELRHRDGLPPEHRWHVPGYDFTCRWTRL